MTQEQELVQERIRRIEEVNVVGDYQLQVSFADGAQRLIDLEPILQGPIFEPLLDLTLFNQVQVDPTFGALEWPNGADIDPAVLYDWPYHLEAIIARHRRFARYNQKLWIGLRKRGGVSS